VQVPDGSRVYDLADLAMKFCAIHAYQNVRVMFTYAKGCKELGRLQAVVGYTITAANRECGYKLDEIADRGRVCILVQAVVTSDPQSLGQPFP
jgi:hypothetical protein